MKDDFDAFEKRLGRETIYLFNDMEDAVVKSTPEGYWVKIKGMEEFKAKPGSSLVADAVLERKEITKKEYDDFE